MGSCDNLTSVGEPVREAAIEQCQFSHFSKEPLSLQQSFLEVDPNFVDTNVDNITAPDGCLGFPLNDEAGCISSNNSRETFMNDTNTVEGRCEIRVGLNIECLVGGEPAVCLNRSELEIDRFKVETDGLLSEKERVDSKVCENRVGLNIESLVGGEPAVCLNRSEIEIDCFKVETDGLLSEKERVDLKDVSKVPLGVRSVMNSPKKDELIENNDARGSFAKGVIKARIDVLGGRQSDTCEKSLPSQRHEMQFESISVADNNGLSEKGFQSDMEEKVNVLTEFDKDTSDQLLPSLGCVVAAELTVDNSSRYYDNHDDMDVSDPFINGVLQMVSEEEMDFPAMIHSKDFHLVSLPPSCERPSGSTTLNCLLGNCVEKNGQKDDKIVERVTEDNSDIFTGSSTDVCNKFLPAEKGKFFFESRSLGIPWCHSGKENELKVLNNVDALIVECKNNVLCKLEADKCNRTSYSQGGEVPLKSLPLKSSHIGELVSNLDLQNDENVDKNDSVLAADNFVDPVETKNNVGTFVQVPTNKSLRDLGKWQNPDFSSNFLQKTLQIDNKYVGASMGNFEGVLQDKNDDNSDQSAETCTQMPPKVNSDSASLEASFDNGSALQLDAPELSRKDVMGFVNSSSTGDCFPLTSNERKHNATVDYLSETKYPDAVFAYSRRSSRISKVSQNIQTKRSLKNCGIVNKVQHSNESVELIFNAARRRRSCVSKRARSCRWGLLENVAQVFRQSDELVSNQAQKKSRGRECSKRQNKNPENGSLLGSSQRNFVSGSCLRFKVKMGKETGVSTLNISFPDVDNSSTFDTFTSDSRTKSYGGATLGIPKLDNGVEDKLVETEKHFQFSKTPDEAQMNLDQDGSVMDIKHENKNLEGITFSGKSAEDADSVVFDSNKVTEASGGAREDRYTDPGTSPDSEVINTMPDAQITARHQEELCNVVLNTSRIFDAATETMSGKKGKRKEKKKDKRSGSGSCLLDDSTADTAVLNFKQPKNYLGRQKMDNGFYHSQILSSSPSVKDSRKTSNSEEVSAEPMPLLGEAQLGISGEAQKVESCLEAKISCSTGVDPQFIESKSSNDFLPFDESKGLSSNENHHKGHCLSKSLKSTATRKGKPESLRSTKSQRRNFSGEKVYQRKSINKSKVKEKDAGYQALDRLGCDAETGCHISGDTGKNDTCGVGASEDVANLNTGSGGGVEQHNPDSAWVRCDDCHKWRRISVALAKIIDGKCRWICQDNLDKAFADCSIPQEKSNTDINYELGISDADEDANDAYSNQRGEKGLEDGLLAVPHKARFKGITSNQFLQRSRKKQTIDEIMVCHCKPPFDNGLGCGDECLNRMLNIECVRNTCPCGDLCSNQQFQQRKYPTMEWFKTGKKGYGLRVLEDVRKGQFLIEYVGEVLDMQAYEARQKEYAAKGEKHFYFMTLNGSEVIDAGAKGNFGRFINHSCEPNCRTEKWMVNGEICIGVFALKDIKKRQEITFDYNYVRVFGAAAKKCYCDSPHCRGYIGGDPLNAEVIVQGDSDEEYPEPVMLEDDEFKDSMKRPVSRTNSPDGVELQVALNVGKESEKIFNSRTTVQQVDNTTGFEDSTDRSASANSQLLNSMEFEESQGKLKSSTQLEEVSQRIEDVTSKLIAATNQHDILMDAENLNKSSCSTRTFEVSFPSSMLSKTSPDEIDSNTKFKNDAFEGKWVLPKSHPRLKTSRSPGSVKRGKSSSCISTDKNKVQVMMSNKSQVMPLKPKKSFEGSSSGHIETVEEKLNELLDADGGISKRKEAPKGYLKLLLLTAASGHSGSREAIQSNRDLSMILDALLKTKSRVVLTDIINKNGLRMLHNIMKQYRRDFKKIPILRKLLKVLEYLALGEIIKLEHISGGPPCPGMESFTDSILSLTEHDDKQVHQIARNFRDRWIPKAFRKHGYMDKDEVRMELRRTPNCSRVLAFLNHWHDQDVRPTEAIDCVMQSKATSSVVNAPLHEVFPEACVSACQSNCTQIRKRKSRWDQPAKPYLDSSSQSKEHKMELGLPQQIESNQLTVSSEVVHSHIANVIRVENNGASSHQSCCQQDEDIADTGRQNMQEDIPPGFSAPFNPPPVSSANRSYLKCPPDVVVAHPQKKFISRLSVSYGIPLTVLQQFGSPHTEISGSWAVAPGTPFHPFPPLPPFPREKKCPLASSAVDSVTMNEHKEDGQWQSCGPPTCLVDNRPTAAIADQGDVDVAGVNSRAAFKRMRGSSQDLGRRYFRQQKWRVPSWIQNGLESMGNNTKGGTGNVDVGNVTNQPRNSFVHRI